MAVSLLENEQDPLSPDFTGPAAPLASALADRYRFERELGAGGMATVYLAEDLRHRRHVAIKVLHPELSAVLGSERFLKEIELTASLQHPHILPLFDSGSADGLLFYVMPFVEGETLRARLERETQLPVADVLRMATEICDALSYAHGRGVVHRDIKPENILLQNGHALVADFGIALAVEHAGGQRMTQTGLSLGTPQYMAPEQAMGERSIDARADIYALGAVIYEMLAGEPPFTGPSAQAIVAQVITASPTSLLARRKSVPQHVDDAVLQALEKLPADRFSTAAAFGAALNGSATGSITPASRRPAANRRLLIALSVFAACAVILATVALVAWRRAAATAQNRDVVRFTMPVAPPNDADGTVIIDVAPDGKTIAYADRSTSDKGGVYVRALNRGEPALIAGTVGARAVSFSPDGASIAYATVDDEIRVVSLAGGAPVPVMRGATWFNGIDWGEDGNIYFVRRDSGVIARVPAKGGATETLGTMESSSLPLGFRLQRNPRLLPGGGAVAFSVFRGSTRGCDIEVLDLRTRVEQKVAQGCYVVGARDGWLLFVTTDGTLEAIAFDDKTHTTHGAARPLLTNVYELETEAQIALSNNGTLIYIPSVAPRSQLVWLSREGVETPLGAVIEKPLVSVALSPQGNRIALSGNNDRATIWMYDLSSQTLSPFSRDGQLSYRPAWTPDGGSIVFASDRLNPDGLRWLWMRSVDGRDSVRLFVRSGRHAQEVSWVASSPWVVYRTGFDDGRTNRDLRYFKPGSDTTSHAFLETRADELNPALSPDGRWLAYVSNETGRDEVYVAAFPGPGETLRVSTDGGTGPLWSHDGRSLFYRATDGRFMSVSVAGATSLTLSNRRALFSASPYAWDRQHQSYDISADDRRLLFIRPQGDPTLNVVLHWFDEVAERLDHRR